MTDLILYSAANFYAAVFEWKFQQHPVKLYLLPRRRSSQASGDIFPNESAVSKEENITGGGAKLFISIHDLKATIEASLFDLERSSEERHIRSLFRMVGSKLAIPFRLDRMFFLF